MNLRTAATVFLLLWLSICSQAHAEETSDEEISCEQILSSDNSKTLQKLNCQLDDSAEFVLGYAILLAGIGVLSMAIWEAIKKIFQLRERYFIREYFAWLEWDVGTRLLKLSTGHPPPSERSIWSPASHHGYSIFTLDLERLVAHLETSLELVLSSPTREDYEQIYRFFTKDLDSKVSNAWVEQSSRAHTADSTPEQDKAIADTYAEVHQWVERKLDSFQVQTKVRWVFINQRASWAIGTILLAGLLWSTYPPEDLADFSRIVVLSILGGIVSPVAKDIVAAIQKLRA